MASGDGVAGSRLELSHTAQQKTQARPQRTPCAEGTQTNWRGDQPLRWRIRLRLRRFLRPSFRRPLPDFFVPIRVSLPCFGDDFCVNPGSTRIVESSSLAPAFQRSRIVPVPRNWGGIALPRGVCWIVTIAFLQQEIEDDGISEFRPGGRQSLSRLPRNHDVRRAGRRSDQPPDHS